MSDSFFKIQAFECHQWSEVRPPESPVPFSLMGSVQEHCLIHLWKIAELPPRSKEGSLAACRDLLSYYLGPDCEIRKNENGKPIAYVSQGSQQKHPVQFSITHTKKTFFVAFIQNYDIGIDAEELGASKSWKPLARRFYAPEEVDQLLKAAPENQEDLFYQFWTLKESMVKCRGGSLFTEFKSAQFQIDPGRIQLLNTPPDLANLRFFHRRDTHYFSITVTKMDH